MVKIINGEIVDDHDPRARSLMQAQQHFLLLQQQQQQQQQQLQQHTQHQQQQPYYPYPPYGYYPQYAYHQPPPPHHFPPEYQHYYQQQQHQSPFASYETEQDLHAADSTGAVSPAASTHLAPPSPALTAHQSPSLSHRRLSFSSNPPPATSSPSLSSRRLSFSSLLPPPSNSNPLSTPPAPARRLSLSSPSPLSHLQPTHPTNPALPIPPPPAALYPRRHPSSYNLFGLPSITIAEIQVRPHVYLLAALLLYFIGPPVLVPLLASFFFYRWHLAREEDAKEKDRLEQKFSVFRYAKSRPRYGNDTSGSGTRIHSLRDIQG